MSTFVLNLHHTDISEMCVFYLQPENMYRNDRKNRILGQNKKWIKKKTLILASNVILILASNVHTRELI